MKGLELEFIKDFYLKINLLNDQQSLDYVSKSINSLLMLGEFELVDEILKGIDNVNLFKIEVLDSILNITFKYKSKLASREDFIKKVDNHNKKLKV